MFENTATLWIEILVLFSVGAFLIGVLGVYVYKKIHHIPTGECAYCAAGKKNRLLRQYHKKYCKN